MLWTWLACDDGSTLAQDSGLTVSGAISPTPSSTSAPLPPGPNAVSITLTDLDPHAVSDPPCAPARDADYADWPGGRRMRLETDPLLNGVPAQLTATGATPGDRVVFHRGLICALDCPSALDGACFQPAQSLPIAEGVADAAGVAAVIVTPDAAWAGWFVLQATAPDAPARYLSQPVVDRGGPWTAPMGPIGAVRALAPVTLRKQEPYDTGVERYEMAIPAGRRARVTWTCDALDCPSDALVSVVDGAVERFGAGTVDRLLTVPSGFALDTGVFAAGSRFTLDFDLLDAAAPIPWYPDADGDGWGDGQAAPTLSASPVPGTSAAGTDCDDTDPAVHPWGEEVCGDGRDEDCSEGDRPCSVPLDSRWTPGSAGTRVSGGSFAQLGGWVATGDLDGDGRDDLATGWAQGARTTAGAIVPFPSRRDGGPDSLWSWPGLESGPTGTIGDADGDGVDDLLLADTVGGQVVIRTGPFDPGEIWHPDRRVLWLVDPLGIALPSLIDDGDPDLVLTWAGGSGPLTAVFADPLLDTTSTAAASGSGANAAPAITDLDGDGFDDLVLSEGCLFTGPLPAPYACLQKGEEIGFLTAGDVDGDGRSDALIATTGAVWAVNRVWSRGDALAEIAWAQVDGLADVHALVLHRDADGAAWLVAADPVGVWAVGVDGPGTFERDADGTLLAQIPADSLASADLDGDAAADLLIGAGSLPWAAHFEAGTVWILWGS